MPARPNFGGAGCGGGSRRSDAASLGRGDDTVGNPHRAQISQFELFLLLELDNILSIERFEPTVSQSTVSSPLLVSDHP